MRAPLAEAKDTGGLENYLGKTALIMEMRDIAWGYADANKILKKKTISPS